MGKSRKVLRVCLFFIVTIAVALGLFYYLYDMRETKPISEGTLITCVRGFGGGLWHR